MRRDEEHTLGKVFKTDIPGKRKRGARKKEERTTENKKQAVDSGLGNVRYLN